MRKRIHIGDDERRVVPGADHIFPRSGVDRGFSANGAVHLREQRRRHLDIRNSAMINRRDKSREIAHHAAAQGNEK